MMYQPYIMVRAMTVNEVLSAIEFCWYPDFPDIEFNGELFPFTIIGRFMILGPEQSADEIREQLAKLDDDFELITAVRMKVC